MTASPLARQRVSDHGSAAQVKNISGNRIRMENDDSSDQTL